ncbi:MAG TPA: hypothetical protein VEW95_09455 [Candidatus Limnocylindrales bacterium]|nr:hypothetical protein [Candidatus Limnocylindrales bacterium]
MTASEKCKLCGARFDVPGAVGDLDDHMKNFHPGKSKSDKAPDTDLPTPDEAVEALRSAIDQISTLETENAELRAEIEQLKGSDKDDDSAGNVTDEELGKLTKPQLEELAAKEGADLSGAKTNADRVDAIRKHRSATS